MNRPVAKMAFVSNLFVRMMHFSKAGDCNEGHVHTYDHITLLSKGSVEVDVEGNKTIFKAPHMIFITRGKKHFLTALEDDTVASCLHALSPESGVEAQEILLEASMVPAGVDDPTLAEVAK